MDKTEKKKKRGGGVALRYFQLTVVKYMVEPKSFVTRGVLMQINLFHVKKCFIVLLNKWDCILFQRS